MGWVSSDPKKRAAERKGSRTRTMSMGNYDGGSESDRRRGSHSGNN